MIDEIVNAARRPDPEIVRRTDTKGSDGKWHSLSFPCGVTPTDETRDRYALLTRDGTTVGRSGRTADEVLQRFLARRDANDATFRANLEAMSPADLQRQADYWLKEH